MVGELVYHLMRNGHIIGPHFLNGILTGTVFNEFPQQKLPELLENIL